MEGLIFNFAKLTSYSEMDNLTWDVAERGAIYSFFAPNDYTSGIHPTNYGTLIITKIGNNTTLQIIISSSFSVYMRSQANQDGWSEWKKV